MNMMTSGQVLGARRKVQVRAKRMLSVQRILTWAFADECAQLWRDAETANPDRGGGYGLEYVMIQQARLGCRVDGGGTSDPHDDAEAVAAAVGNLPVGLGGRQMAVRVAELARAGMAPDWMPHAQTRCVPVSRRLHKHGMFSDTEVAEVIKYRHRGRVVEREVRFCPVTYSPSQAHIAAARRGYLDWWGALHDIRSSLQTMRLRDHAVSDAMPAMQPWKP